jgi:hypothetical protein
MPYDPAQHHRRSIRLPWYDYARRGAYFVTICTESRGGVFGEVRGGKMQLSEVGRLVETCWHDLPKHAPGLELDAFQVMPNHVHCVLHLVRATPASSESPVRLVTPNVAPRPRGPAPGHSARLSAASRQRSAGT